MGIGENYNNLPEIVDSSLPQETFEKIQNFTNAFGKLNSFLDVLLPKDGNPSTYNNNFKNLAKPFIYQEGVNQLIYTHFPKILYDFDFYQKFQTLGSYSKHGVSDRFVQLYEKYSLDLMEKFTKGVSEFLDLMRGFNGLDVNWDKETLKQKVIKFKEIVLEYFYLKDGDTIKLDKLKETLLDLDKKALGFIKEKNEEKYNECLKKIRETLESVNSYLSKEKEVDTENLENFDVEKIVEVLDQEIKEQANENFYNKIVNSADENSLFFDNLNQA